MTDYAKIGTQTLLERDATKRARQAGHPHGGAQAHRPFRGSGPIHPGARPGHPVVGWTPPTVIYDKMRHIDAGAKELNALMLANVQNPSLRSAWEAWYGNWQTFFEKYQGALARLGAIFYTDDLAVQTEDYRRIYESFRASYAAERNAQGQPLPSPAAPVPGVLVPGKNQGEDKPSGWSVPWWVWIIGGVGVTVGGYFAYKALKQAAANMKAKRQAMDAALPGVLAYYKVPPELSKAAISVGGPKFGQPDVAGDPGKGALAPSGLFVDSDPPHVHEVHARVPQEAMRYTHTQHHHGNRSRDAASSRDHLLDDIEE